MSISTSEQLSQLKDFLGHIANFKGDLSNVTAPPFVLARKSATEFPASWCAHQPLFLEQGASERPELRALAVLKNFIASLKTQTYTGSTEKDGAKKPLNAFLGELFIAEFEGETPRTKLFSEQVSHHPPVTACSLYNRKHGISAEGYVAQETSYSATHGVSVHQVGHAVVHIEQYDEDHLMTLPTLRVKGLLSGSPYPELSGTCYISSSSGYTSKIEFEGKKLLGIQGKKNAVTAHLYHNDEPRAPLYEIGGQWNQSFTVHDCQVKKDIETVEIDAIESTPLIVPPVEQQDPWETRKAWKPVLDSIERGNIKGVSQSKNEIEEGQRALRREETDKGIEWPRIFFQRSKPDSRRLKLLQVANEPLNYDRTDGFWKFIGSDQAESVKKPYHDSLLPTGKFRT